MPVFDPLVAEYRYFVADFLSNSVLAEIPFKDVSYERAIKGAGSFSGSIPVIDKTSAYNLYDNTMPGKTALYVVRNNECVWGGVIWSRSYSVQSRELSVNASEFTSYLHHRYIWKTYSHDFSCTVAASGGVANVSLVTGSFNFSAGTPVKILFYEATNAVYNSYTDVLASPAPTSTTFSVSIPGLPNGSYIKVTALVRVDTYDYVRQLLDEMLVDFSNIDFPNEEIQPGIQTTSLVTHKLLTSNIATLTTATEHNILPGQTFDVYSVDNTFNGTYVATAATDTTFSYERVAGNVAYAAVTPVSASVTTVSSSPSDLYAILFTSAAAPFVVGDIVQIAGVDAAGVPSAVYNGSHAVTELLSIDLFGFWLHWFKIAIPATATEEYRAVSGTASIYPVVVAGTYGSYPANADFGLDYSTNEYSGEYISSLDKVRRGYELKSIGDELDEYSDTINGFEYRIDCSYDTSTSAFTRTFVLLPIDVIADYRPLDAGEVPDITWFGAQNLVFEYPGNISDVSLDESAENAATRFFVTGNQGDLGSDASQPYSAATATTLLYEGWPLLDQEEALNDTQASRSTANPNPESLYDEDVLYSYAQRYLAEFQPPVGDLTVSVNGSLSPKIGSYNPGDWCCIIINDDFVRLRLVSNLEPRSDLLLRKIESYSVTVPNNPSFPEQVSLKLITEWNVDSRG